MLRLTSLCPVVCRLLLGICEGSITAGFLIVVRCNLQKLRCWFLIARKTSMFYTHVEATRRVGFWFLMNGKSKRYATRGVP
jgi:ACS family allantoate permease-like MFS transporter